MANMQHLKGENFRFHPVASASEAREGKVNLVNVGPEPLKPEFGVASEVAGRSAFEALEAAVEALRNGEIDVLVTAPINKATVQGDDFRFPGHTEYLEARFKEVVKSPAEGDTASDTTAAAPESEDTGVSEENGDGQEFFGELSPKAQMILFNDDLKVALLTTHLPLAEVSAHVTQASIIEAVRRFDATLRRDFGCDRPRIAVLSLNPHAGDDGLLGSEEKDVILPALGRLREKGILAFGPYPSDGFFGSGEWRKFDGVLAMYHDQGLAPFKTLAGSEGVNYTAGLEIIRTSPDHGTAYDIAGKMKADPASMRNAIYNAIDIYRRRCRYDEMISNPLG
ncbi:MAG: 4-hydroxythreonine-4-phosphate dehydrogenase PdxA [Muribaculaceae bacterium]|nr:4-hydroxythreonine-4-phosphate dehydrogenase PdxA [Muribaculaceae bacterium]